jgi:hypothetical protein
MIRQAVLPVLARIRLYYTSLSSDLVKQLQVTSACFMGAKLIVSSYIVRPAKGSLYLAQIYTYAQDFVFWCFIFSEMRSFGQLLQFLLLLGLSSLLP